MEGLIFGIIDNGVMLIGAVLGLKFLPCRKGFINGLIGAGLGNALSDFLAGIGEGGLRFAFGTLIGCLIVMLFIPIIRWIKHNGGKHARTI